MVEKFKKILKRIKTEKGSVSVFAIIKMDEITDKWSIIFSSEWLVQDNKSETFNYLRTILLEELNSEEVTSIARLGIFLKNEHLIQLILGAIKIEDNGVTKLQDTSLNGYKIHEAYIFSSNKDE